jgi:transposase-like protein
MDFQLFYSDEKIEVYKNNNQIKICYQQPHTIILNSTDHKDIDNEIIRLLRIRTVENKKLFLQKDIGKLFGLSRQMINRRWQVYKNEGLLALLSMQWENSKITPELLDRLTELAVDNPFLTYDEIKKILISEGLCTRISNVSLNTAQTKMDGRLIVKLLRKKADKINPGSFIDANYIIKKLFGFLEILLKTVPVHERNKVIDYNSYEYLKSCYQGILVKIKKNIKKDAYTGRVKLARDKRRIIGYLKGLINNNSQLFHKCPDCKTPYIKYIFKRKRYYINKSGKKMESFSEIYKCLNNDCNTKYYTVPPKGVELYARVHKDIKKKVLRWYFHLRGSLSRICDELANKNINVSITTVLRWLKKAGEESVNLFKLYDNKELTQSLCIDEKWIKIRNDWKYIFVAVSSKNGNIKAMELYPNKDKNCMKTFLTELKLAGFNPYNITTDLLLGYESVVKEIFPDCIYNQCILHAERDAKRIVKKAFSKSENEQEWKKILTKKIYTLFRSKKLKQVKKRYFKIMKLRTDAPEKVDYLFTMLSKYFPKLCLAISNKKIVSSTNAVERVIGEIEEKYHSTKGFTNFYFARFFIKAFWIYYSFRKISYGPNKGKNRLMMDGCKFFKVKFDDYLIQTYH